MLDGSGGRGGVNGLWFEFAVMMREDSVARMWATEVQAEVGADAGTAPRCAGVAGGSRAVVVQGVAQMQVGVAVGVRVRIVERVAVAGQVVAGGLVGRGGGGRRRVAGVESTADGMAHEAGVAKHVVMVGTRRGSRHFG